MLDYNDLGLFLKVVEHGGLGEAARRLGVTKSLLSRRVTMLEQALQAQLVVRTSRGTSVTAAGQVLAERCKDLFELGDRAIDAMRSMSSKPAGTLRISCPTALARHWLTPLMPRFLVLFPEVRATLLVTDHAVGHLRERVDVSVRVRRPPFEDSSLVVRSLARTRDRLLASPAVVARYGPALDPGDLARWPLLALTDSPDAAPAWHLHEGEKTITLPFDPRYASSDLYDLKHAAVAGLGVALLPPWICADEVRSGSLIPVLPAWQHQESDIQLAFMSRKGLLPAARAFIDLLVTHLPGDDEAGG